MKTLVVVLLSFSSGICFALESKRVYLIQKDEHANIYKVEFSKKEANATQVMLKDPTMSKNFVPERTTVSKKIAYVEPRAKASLLSFKAQNIKGLFREPRVKFESEELSIGLRDGAQVESLRETQNFERVLEDLRDFTH